MPRSRSKNYTEQFSTVPVLPARDSVVFPGLIHTLHVAREASKRAVRAAMASSSPVFIVSQRDHDVEDPRPNALFRIGCLCEPLQAVPLPDGSLRVALRGTERAEALRFSLGGGYIRAVIEPIAERAVHSETIEAKMRAALEALAEVLERSKRIPPEAIETVAHQETPGGLADAIAHHLPLRLSQKQEILELRDPEARLEAVFQLVGREQRLLGIQSEIVERVDREFATNQREYYLREQLRTIQSELEALGETSAEYAHLRDSLDEADLPLEAQRRAHEELARLERQPVHSPESLVCRNYLEWMAALPWNRLSPDKLDVAEAKQILNSAHYGLHAVKERILDYLAVRQLSQRLRGPILCFVGPPGVGKTSVGRSIAEALGREFVRISLGGLRDEAEIRGHRRTYVGAMPGRLIQSLRQCRTRNPVIVLDEIDKMAADRRGDPSSALLEALDPAQNDRFSDHFLETPFDLSAVVFVATANLEEDIPPALRDRFEIVRFNSYTDEERLQIARQFILPRQILEHGLPSGAFRIETPALEAIVRDYTREAGVRELDRTIAAVCRKAARAIVETGKTGTRVTERRLAEWIGSPRHFDCGRWIEGDIGVARGLVVTAYGGAAIPFEVALLGDSLGPPTVRMTGNLGSVMKESAETALSCVTGLRLVSMPVEKVVGSVHIHVPDNAIPKEGPSAGLTVAVALASALSGRPVRRGLAMTGEITLRGRILPVGGIRDKLVAAERAGVRTVLLPELNRPDLREVPASVMRNLEVVFVESASHAIERALEPTAVAVARPPSKSRARAI